MKINIIFPFAPYRPAGGTRVMFEYANHLKKNGNEVVIYYSLSCPYYVNRTPFLFRCVYFNLFLPPKWFELEKGIKRKLITRVCDKEIEDGDIVFYTWWALSYDVQNLDVVKGKKFNLIQDIELWTGHEEKVKASYFFKNINNVVISEHIRKYINSIGSTRVEKVLNAIDHRKFYIKNPIEDRNPFSICMMYSKEVRKGSKYGLMAISILKKKYPQLKVNIFSVFDFDENIDFDINFCKRPPDLNDIMNNSAIFFSPSIQEGMALPPMEGMHAGCALVCSNIDGHSEYAFDHKTALLFESKNVEDMVMKVSSLLENDLQRQEIARNGNVFIRKNTWDSSTKELISIFKQQKGN